MFQQLSTKLNDAMRKVQGKHQLTEKNMTEALEAIRDTLMDADAAQSVVDQFMATVQKKALGQKVLSSVEPGQQLTKIVYDALIDVLSDHQDQQALQLAAKPPVVIMVVGLQGAGKTTTVAKLAHWLKKNQKKHVMVCSTDVYRPAAITQLQHITQAHDIETIVADAPKAQPLAIAQHALQTATRHNADVLLIDTAGRSHIDQAMMSEALEIWRLTKPTETLFVLDGMTGQDAANSTHAFQQAFKTAAGHDKAGLTGAILTKMDGDQRGGAALSLCTIAKVPIKFIGTSEKIEGFDAFDPKRIAGMMLDQGDIVAFVEQMQQLDQKKAKAIGHKMRKGQMNMDDLLAQIQQLKSLGGTAGLLKHLPGANQMMQQETFMQQGDATFKTMEALIQSMTPQERHNPALLQQPSRKKRIIRGSGTHAQDYNKLLKQYKNMQKISKKMKGKNMEKMMRAMQGKMQNPFDR